jgi:hypothetical protein
MNKCVFRIVLKKVLLFTKKTKNLLVKGANDIHFAVFPEIKMRHRYRLIAAE